MTNLSNAIKAQKNAENDLSEMETLLGMPDADLMQQSISAFLAQGKNPAAMYEAAIAEWQAASEELISEAEASDVPTAADLARMTKRALSEELPRYQKRLAKLQAMMPPPPEPEPDGGEYGMTCIECNEPATENINGEWYCKEHVPALEKQHQELPRGSSYYVLEVYIARLTAEERTALLDEGFHPTHEPDTIARKFGKRDLAALETMAEKLYDKFPGRVSTNKSWKSGLGGARPGAGRKPTHKGEPLYQQGYEAGYQASKRENAGRKRDWWKFRLMTEAREIEGQRLHRGVVLYDGNVFWQDKRWYASFEPALQCADETRDRLYRDMSVPESEAGYLDKEIRRFRRVEFELTPEQRAEIAQPVHIEQ